ncbi:MAG: VOC family protein [Kofleriaceae bacterium]
MATLPTAHVIVSLPTANLGRAFAFYRTGLGLALAVPGEGDAMPEPVMFKLNDGLQLMLVPSTGFGWVIGDHKVAPAGSSECVLGLGAKTPTEVDLIVARAIAAGATVVAEPAQQRWGYSGSFADPDGHVWLIVAR